MLNKKKKKIFACVAVKFHFMENLNQQTKIKFIIYVYCISNEIDVAVMGVKLIIFN